MAKLETAEQGISSARMELADGAVAGAGLRQAINEAPGLASRKEDDCLIDLLRHRSAEYSRQRPSRLDGFLHDRSVGSSLRRWCGPQVPADKDELIRRLNYDIGVIDQLITDQVNAILHHPRLQQLEATWRGLQYLVEQVDDRGQPVMIRMLDVSALELKNDLELAVDFDRSELFKKVYTAEFGMPGGTPYGVIIGDFDVQLRDATQANSTSRTRALGISSLRKVAQVATAAFCPFIASADPSLFGVDEFLALEHASDVTRLFRQKNYLPWQRLRDDIHTRFVGLTLPRVLMRLPYRSGPAEGAGFQFHEQLDAPHGANYLWGSAAFAFGGVVIRSFQETGWLAGIRGVIENQESGGLVTSLPVHCFSTDRNGVAPKASTDLIISEDLENQLGDLGFLPFTQCKGTEFTAFYTASSLHQPQTYDQLSATLNARVSAMLQYVFCVSRFAHYLKRLSRDKVGNFSGPTECQTFLQNWIAKYVTSDGKAPLQTKARLPLRKASIRVAERIDEPGKYDCLMHLWPHYALDELTGTIQLETVLASAGSAS